MSGERKGQLSLFTQMLGGQWEGNLEEGSFSFLFYYLPFLLNSMGGAWGLWHCSQKLCPCQAEFSPLQALIDCETKIESLFGSNVMGKILHLQFDGAEEGTGQKDYIWYW